MAGAGTTWYSYDHNNWLIGADFDLDGRAIGTGGLLPDDSDSGTYSNGDTAILEASNSFNLTEGFHAQTGSTVTVHIVSNGGGDIREGDYDVSNISYDANGNIQSLKRNKGFQNGGNAMDDLTYTYESGTNQLLQVTDAEGDVEDAEDIGDQPDANNYSYNKIGQLTRNDSEKISYIYNATGLVTQILRDNKPMVTFFYNDRNHRIRKDTYDDNGINVLQTTHYVRDVAGSVMAIYINNDLAERPIYGSGRIGVAYGEANEDGDYIYELADHLGNVRTVFSNNNGDAQGESYTDYYPFGMPMPGRNLVGDYRYAFQGQEKDSETDKEAFELRLWDSRIGRWLTTDPAGQYTSPYLGMGNNPINGIDPDGGFFNPVFGSDGTHRGNTKEGFTGEAIIYDGNIDFTKLSAKELTGSGGSFLSRLVFSNPGVRDKIEGFIVNHKLEDGLNLDNTVTIQNAVDDYNYLANAADDKFTILRGVDKFGQSVADEAFEPTVENLRSLINGHEVTGHVLLDIGGSPAEHYEIHTYQVSTKQFQSTTDKFKAHVFSQFAGHALFSGRIQEFKSNPTFFGGFNKYGRSRFESNNPRFIRFFR